MEEQMEPPTTNFGSSLSSSDNNVSSINSSLISGRLDVVPDSLIALAKDERYVKDIQDLLLQILSPVLPRRRHSLIEQESWMVASLLCLALGLRHTRKGTTLGMETVGLQFPEQKKQLKMYSNGATTMGRWKLVASILMTLSWAYAFSPHLSSSSSSSSTTTTTTTSNNNDNSIGGTVQEQQQQQQQSASDETLRGESRREFHERQRRAMLLRAQQAAAAEPSRRTNFNNTAIRNGSNNNEVATVRSSSSGFLSVDEVKKKIKALLLKFAKVLAAAVLSPFEGPHTSLADTHQQQQQQNGRYNSIQQAGRWLAKLQMAHFCLTGMYPTWMHRFSGHSLIPEMTGPGTTTTTTRLYHRPTTSRLVGLLLGAQVVATFVKASSSAVSHWLVLREQKQREALSSSPQQRQSAPAVVFESHSTTTPNSNDVDVDQHHNTSPKNSSGRSRSICSICKMERNHPAAPESCGHVFCWRCLVQWVSAIRPECPLCRSSCRPQDIVALYNYEPAK